MILPPLALTEALPNMIEGGVFAVERGDDPMAQQQSKPALDTVDPVWARIRREAEESARREPELATFIYSTILHRDTLEAAVIYRLAERLDHPALSGELIRQAYGEALKDIPALREAFRADLMATVDRDPAKIGRASC